MSSFDKNENIFTQQTYEVRINAEADIIVALEALKDEVHWLTHSLSEMEQTILHTSHVIEVNSAGILANNY